MIKFKLFQFSLISICGMIQEITSFKYTYKYIIEI